MIVFAELDAHNFFRFSQLTNPVLRIVNAKGFAKPWNEAYREKYEVIGTR